VGSDIEVFEDKLIHTPKGMLGAMKLMGGAKSIPFASITSVAYTPAGIAKGGKLQFTVVGSTVLLENVFQYRGGFGCKKDNALIEKIKDHIEARMGPKSAPGKEGAGLADEIAKLAQLRDDGILSEEEFTKAKQQLLSGD
jgi:hypothetical protein